MKKILTSIVLLSLFSIAGAQPVINVIGDSYVANHARPSAETWHSKMAFHLGMKYNNYGRNGSCVAWDRTNDARGNFGPALWQRYTAMDPDADYVLIIAGHNDAMKVGTDKAMLKTFTDSLEVFISGVEKLCPHAAIGYVTPWYVDHDGFQEVSRVIKKVCRKHHIPVLDNCNPDCVIKVRDEEFRARYFQSPRDNAHLNSSGHDCFLPVAMEWFEKNVMKKD